MRNWIIAGVVFVCLVLLTAITVAFVNVRNQVRPAAPVAAHAPVPAPAPIVTPATAAPAPEPKTASAAPILAPVALGSRSDNPTTIIQMPTDKFGFVVVNKGMYILIPFGRPLAVAELRQCDDEQLEMACAFISHESGSDVGRTGDKSCGPLWKKVWVRVKNPGSIDNRSAVLNMLNGKGRYILRVNEGFRGKEVELFQKKKVVWDNRRGWGTQFVIVLDGSIVSISEALEPVEFDIDRDM